MSQGSSDEQKRREEKRKESSTKQNFRTARSVAQRSFDNDYTSLFLLDLGQRGVGVLTFGPRFPGLEVIDRNRLATGTRGGWAWELLGLPSVWQKGSK